MVKILGAIVFAISGLLITLIGTLFTIEGLTLWLPDPEWSNIVILMAVSFELVKLTTSSFLFHYLRDRGFPIFFKFVMFILTLALVLVSSAAIFVHLNKYASTTINSNVTYVQEIKSLEDRNIYLNNKLTSMNDQISSLDKNMVGARIRLIDTYEKENIKINDEILVNNNKISEYRAKLNSEDKFSFLNGFTDLTGMSRSDVYTIFILFLVCLIDPLAISVILAATYIIASYKKEIPEEKEAKVNEEPKEEILLETINSNNLDTINELKELLPTNIEPISEVVTDKIKLSDEEINEKLEALVKERLLHLGFNPDELEDTIIETIMDKDVGFGSYLEDGNITEEEKKLIDEKLLLIIKTIRERIKPYLDKVSTNAIQQSESTIKTPSDLSENEGTEKDSNIPHI